MPELDIYEEDLTPEQRDIYDCIGSQAYEKLVQRYGGLSIYIAKADSVIRSARDEKIRRDFNGYNFKSRVRLPLMKYNCRNSLKRFICNTPNIYGTVIITDNGTKYIGGVFMTSQQIFTIVFQLVLTGGIGIITYFLKRTMDDIDKCKSGLDKVRENYVSKDEFDKCKTDITDVKQNYLTKEDFYREQLKTEQKLDKIMDILMEMKGEK